MGWPTVATLFVGQNETRPTRFSDRRHLRVDRPAATIFFRGADGTRFPSSDHSSRVLLRLHRRSCRMAGPLPDFIERSDPVSSDDVPAILEKATYAVAVFILFSQQRVSTFTLATALVDLILGVLFVLAYIKTANINRAAATQ